MTASGGEAEEVSSSARKLDGHDHTAPLTKQALHIRTVNEAGQVGVTASLMISLSLLALWISNRSEVLALSDCIILGLVSSAIVWAHLQRKAGFLKHFTEPFIATHSENPPYLELRILLISGALDVLVLIAINWGGCSQLIPWLVIVPIVCLTGGNITWCLVVLLAVSTESILCMGLVHVTLKPGFASVPFAWITLALLIVHQRAWALQLSRMQTALEEIRAANEKLTHALAMRRNFITTMTHELRTPTQGIISLIEELKESLHEANANATSTVSVIADCSDYLLGLVDNILDFEKLDASQMVLEQIPFSIVDELNKAIGIVRTSAEKKGIKLQRYVSVDNPVHIGDSIRFRQVVLNLLSNAIKFTPPGGQVEVTLENNDPACTSQVKVVVSDNGIGIASDKMDHLFSSFTQADTSTYRMYGGSGLGLSICKKLCENMGGTIGCESKLGEGSTFHFSVSLPVADKDEAIVSDGPERAVAASLGLRVLLVDDNQVNRKTGTRILSRLGCSTQSASNGAECLSLLEQEGPFDLVIMDCNMPVMDGFQAAEEIRRREKDSTRDLEGPIRVKNVPILALTASATKEHSKRCMEAGMSGVLFKPLRRETLRAALHQWATAEDPGGQASCPCKICADCTSCNDTPPRRTRSRMSFAAVSSK